MGLFSVITGYRWSDKYLAKFKWGEISRSWGLALALCHFEEHWSLNLHLIYFQIFIILWPSRIEPESGMESYGISVRWGQDWGWATDWHLNWGRRCKIVHMPWAWEWHRRSILARDGRSWFHELAGHRTPRDVAPIGLPMSNREWFTLDAFPHWTKQLPYRYVLRSGEIQERTATIAVHEMEWRWRWLMWLSWPRLVRRTIEVKFSDEMGERSGSWKGGCIGCGYELRANETPEECLNRMMRERKF